MSPAAPAVVPGRCPSVRLDLLDSPDWSRPAAVAGNPESVAGSGRRTVPQIALLDVGDWQDLRSARLAALEESPTAFVATSAVEATRPPEDWMTLLTVSTWAVARDEGEVVGIACLAAADPDAPEERFVECVWVTPRLRRRGLVRGMLRALGDNARAEGAERLQLWVLETNSAAYEAYVKLNFRSPVPDVVHDSTKRRDDGTFVQERLMIRSLLGETGPWSDSCRL